MCSVEDWIYFYPTFRLNKLIHLTRRDGPGEWEWQRNRTDGVGRESECESEKVVEATIHLEHCIHCMLMNAFCVRPKPLWIFYITFYFALHSISTNHSCSLITIASFVRFTPSLSLLSFDGCIYLHVEHYPPTPSSIHPYPLHSLSLFLSFFRHSFSPFRPFRVEYVWNKCVIIWFSSVLHCSKSNSSEI